MSNGPPVAAVAVSAVLGIVGLFAIVAWSNHREVPAWRYVADSWQRAWEAEHANAIAWKGASDSQNKLIQAQKELLEERAKYIAVLEQALREGTRVIFGEGQSATEWRLLPQESAIGSTRQ